MTAQEQIEQASNEYAKWYKDSETNIARNGFLWGGLKGMEIQKELDQQEIERLKYALKKIADRARNYNRHCDWHEMANHLDNIQYLAIKTLEP
jgi:hypothetical protein